ncbi:MAG TPA: LamG-like jellyroll fold domain-containing protein [Tepidisphaeraceae bacterium]|jgi:parallel beta-helix repeat protein
MRTPSTRIVSIEQVESRRLLSTTYYVSSTGSDSAAGSSSAPFLTIQHAADRVSAGDTVIVRAGSYAGFILGWDTATAGTAALPIVFKADPAAAAGSVIINAQNPHTHIGIDLEPGCDYITIQGFTVIGGGGIATYPDRGYGIKVTGNYDQVIGNTIHDIDYAVAGIHDNGGDGVLIQGNTIYGMHNHGNANLGHGIYVADADSVTVRDNIIHDNDYIGIHINGDPNVVSHALVTGNLIYNNGQNGINADGLEDSRVENNLIWGYAGFGICLFQIDSSGPSSGNVIANNTIVSTASGAGAAVRMLDGATGNTVFNNVLLGGGGITMRVSDDSLSGLVSDYNVVGSLYQSEDSGATQSLAQWRTARGQDTHSFTATTAQLFINPAANDFHLKPGSAAIDAGGGALNAKTAPSTDRDGLSRPQGSNWDIGAYEVSGAPDTTPPTLSTIAAGSIKPNGATISWNTNEAATSQVEFGTTTSYGSSTTLDTSLLSSHSVVLTALSPGTLYHYRVKSKDASGNITVSGDFTFTTAAADVTPPVISSLSATRIGPGSATIVWTTNEGGDSLVEYGLTTSYGSSSSLNSTLVTSHSIKISGLVPNKLYHFRVKSKDEFGNLRTSGDFTFTTTVAGTVPSGAAGYWTFSESSGTTTADASGHGHTGTLQNGILFGTGQSGNGLVFDGTNDSVRIGRGADLEPTVISLSAWIKLASGTQADWATIIKKTYSNDSAQPWGSYSLSLSPNGQGNFLGFFTGVAGSDGDVLVSPAALQTGVWIHVAATYNPSTGQKCLYINGDLVASSNVTNPLVYDTTSAGDIYLGQDPGAGEAFKGSMDNVGVWGRILTDSEIATLAYAASADTTPPTASATGLTKTIESAAAYTFTVTFSDDVAINAGSIGDGDVLVSGPGGYSQLAKWISNSGSGGHITATYSITAPAGGWTSKCNGTYTIAAKAAQVFDSSGNALAGGNIGSFAMNIPISDHAGNALTSARKVSSIAKGTVRVAEDYVGANDRNDYYKVTLSSAMTLSIKLYNLTDNADLQVFDATGKRIAWSKNSGTTAESLALKLAAGTYYVRVLYLGSNGTYYRLRMAGT